MSIMRKTAVVGRSFRWLLLALCLCLPLLTLFADLGQAGAATTQGGSVGLQGTIPTAPPTSGATITNPTNGQSFSSMPITVNGICPAGLLVKVFSNNVFIGADNCATGSFSVTVSLFSGKNDLVARVYDALDQAGPDSNIVSVTYNDAHFTAVGSLVTLTSDYARKGANPGDQLDWPVVLSGGTGPYAFSVDWGDGTSPTLKSVAFPGPITFSHTYSKAGIYKILIKVTDSNGASAFLQLVGVANGQATQTGSSKPTIIVQTKVLWWPALAAPPLIMTTFWAGRRYELLALRKELESQA